MKKDPDNSGYYSKLGFTVFSLGKLEEAKVTFTKAVPAVLVGGARFDFVHLRSTYKFKPT